MDTTFTEAQKKVLSDILLLGYHKKVDHLIAYYPDSVVAIKGKYEYAQIVPLATKNGKVLPEFKLKEYNSLLDPVDLRTLRSLIKKEAIKKVEGYSDNHVYAYALNIMNPTVLKMIQEFHQNLGYQTKLVIGTFQGKKPVSKLKRVDILTLQKLKFEQVTKSKNIQHTDLAYNLDNYFDLILTLQNLEGFSAKGNMWFNVVQESHVKNWELRERQVTQVKRTANIVADFYFEKCRYRTDEENQRVLDELYNAIEKNWKLYRQ